MAIVLVIVVLYCFPGGHGGVCISVFVVPSCVGYDGDLVVSWCSCCDECGGGGTVLVLMSGGGGRCWCSGGRTRGGWNVGEEWKGGEALCKTGSCMARNYLTYPPPYLHPSLIPSLPTTPLQAAARVGDTAAGIRRRGGG